MNEAVRGCYPSSPCKTMKVYHQWQYAQVMIPSVFSKEAEQVSFHLKLFVCTSKTSCNFFAFRVLEFTTKLVSDCDKAMKICRVVKTHRRLRGQSPPQLH